MRSSLVLLAAFFAGCASAPVSVLPPANLMTLCEKELPPTVDGQSTTLLLLMVTWAEQYHLCAARHGKLVEAIHASHSAD